MTGPRSEIVSRIQGQADQLRTILGGVDDGAGNTFGDRVSWEPSAPNLLTPPSCLLQPPSWSFESYNQDGPSELEWSIWLLAPVDDIMVGRLWMMADAAAALIDQDDVLNAVVLDVEPRTWRPGVANIPAYVVRISAVLPPVA